MLACDTQPAPSDTETLVVDSDEQPSRGALAVAPSPEDDAHERNGHEPAGTKSPTGTTLDATVLAAVARTDRPVRGTVDAKVSIMVFSDFECPYCAKLLPSLEEAFATYGDDVSIIFKQMPLAFHSAAQPAARASLAAAEQGKFWEMHDVMFEHTSQVRALEFTKLAEGIGLDVARFERDMADPKLAAVVLRDIEDAKLLGIRGTPSMVIGNQLIVGAQPLKKILAVIDTQIAAG